MRRWMPSLLVVFAVAGLAGCQSTSGEEADRTVSDVAITAAVDGKLTGDRHSHFSRVAVDTEGGVVRLRGVVGSAEERQRAESLARQVEGVAHVDNRLEVHDQPPGGGRLND